MMNVARIMGGTFLGQRSIREKWLVLCKELITLAFDGRCIRLLICAVGVSAPCFEALRSLARDLMELGATGVMIAPSQALRTDEQIVNYFGGAVEAVGADLPWVLQDYPLTLSVLMTVSVIARIVNAQTSCQTSKTESCSTFDPCTNAPCR